MPNTECFDIKKSIYHENKLPPNFDNWFHLLMHVKKDVKRYNIKEDEQVISYSRINEKVMTTYYFKMKFIKDKALMWMIHENDLPEKKELFECLDMLNYTKYTRGITEELKLEKYIKKQIGIVESMEFPLFP